jgi:phospholipase C
MINQSRSRLLLFIICIAGLGLAALALVFQKANQSKLSTTIPASTLSKTTLPEDKAIPQYDHIFVIVAENKSYDQIIGSFNAPNLNRLAKTYGLATQFYGEVHPSEANYIAMLGGSTFGIHDDDAFYCNAGKVDPFCSHAQESGYANHTIVQPSLIDQLQQRNLTWKGYFEDLPKPGSTAVVAPNGIRALYAVKHNAFMNFKAVQDDPNRAQKIVGFDQLATDLKSGNVPNYSHIVLNQCHEMHGLAECPDIENLIRTGDAKIAQVVNQILQSPSWNASGNSAIVITWDENNGNTQEQTGCCGYDPKSAADFGGGHIATIVITNHGARGITDSTPYNHYSLLRTTEDALGIDQYLNQAGDTAKGVKPMTKLFAQVSKRPG